jgi:hypothetical protein
LPQVRCFYSEEKHRTCGKCGHVSARPA